MKMRIGIVLGCILALICVGAIALFLKHVRGNTMDGSGMINADAFEYLEYSRGGGEFGEIYSLTVRDDVLDYIECEGNGSETIRKTVIIDSETYNTIKGLLSEGEVRKWTKLEKSEYFATDEIRTDFEVDFADGLTIRVEHEDIPPAEGWEKIKEIVKILDELATSEE